MIAIFDVGYFEQSSGATSANAACVLIENWEQEKPTHEFCTKIKNVLPYQPGQFYKRELPCILAAIDKLKTPPRILMIDGFVNLDQNGKPGLGRYLFDSLQGEIPVIGVAKNPYKDFEVGTKVFRGKSTKPLFVTAVGLQEKQGVRLLESMHGSHRIPTVLKRVDQLSRIPV